MVRLEREIVELMQRGNQRSYDPMLVSPSRRIGSKTNTGIEQAQREVVDDIFLSREKIVGLDGVAGAGKTTTLP